MKKCTRCKQLKLETAFNWKQKHLKRASHCKICSRQQVRNHYKKNTSYYLKKARNRNKNLREQHEKFLANFLQNRACIDCGENDLVVLELDHRNHDEKINAISILIRQRRSLDVIKQEIEKCDVRCANCHRRKTAKENNSWRLKYMHL